MEVDRAVPRSVLCLLGFARGVLHRAADVKERETELQKDQCVGVIVQAPDDP